MFSVFSYVWSGFIVLLGIFLNVYSKNETRINTWVALHGTKYLTLFSHRHKRTPLMENVWYNVAEVASLSKENISLQRSLYLVHQSFSSFFAGEKAQFTLFRNVLLENQLKRLKRHIMGATYSTKGNDFSQIKTKRKRKKCDNLNCT